MAKRAQRSGGSPKHLRRQCRSGSDRSGSSGCAKRLGEAWSLLDEQAEQRSDAEKGCMHGREWGERLRNGWGENEARMPTRCRPDQIPAAGVSLGGAVAEQWAEERQQEFRFLFALRPSLLFSGGA